MCRSLLLERRERGCPASAAEIPRFLHLTTQRRDSAVLLPERYSPSRTHPLCCEWSHGEHVDGHLCAEP
jgi:hypothetical protein